MTKAVDPALVRDMANVLIDHGVDPLKSCEVIITLIRVGFPAKQVETHYDAVVAMALIRKTNNAMDRRPH